MKALDTNILVRFLVQDDKKQSSTVQYSTVQYSTVQYFSYLVKRNK